MVAVRTNPAVVFALSRYDAAASEDTPTTDDPGRIRGSSDSVKCRVPRKLIRTTSGGSPMPDETPATLNSTSTSPPIAATAWSIDASSDRSIWTNSSRSTAGRRRSSPTT